MKGAGGQQPRGGERRGDALGVSLAELLRQKHAGPLPGQEEPAARFLAAGIESLRVADPFAALKPLFAALALDPGLAKAANNLAVAFWQLGCPDLARTCAREALRIDPDNRRAKAHLAFLTAEDAADD
ncbi:MAG: hypothetical protein AB1634_01290 [Thermodesulfobacteriota bacterium]